MEASQVQNRLTGRRALTSDELAEMKDLRPRFEKAIELPADSRDGNKAWMFSIDGMLRGEMLRGCLFAGECMLIQAPNYNKARKLARDGLQSTVEALIEEYDNRPVIDSGINVGVAAEVAGRRGRGDGTLRTDPKLKRMIAHLVGKEPWKH